MQSEVLFPFALLDSTLKTPLRPPNGRFYPQIVLRHSNFNVKLIVLVFIYKKISFYVVKGLIPRGPDTS